MTTSRPTPDSFRRVYREAARRIGKAQALLGSALGVKPLLRVADGIIRPYERVRTRVRAAARLAELALEACAGPIEHGVWLRLAVQHLDNAVSAADLAGTLTGRLRQRGIDAATVVVAEMSAVLGVRVGLGTLDVVIAPTRRPPAPLA